MDAQDDLCLIDGKLVAGNDGRAAVLNPATETPCGHYTRASTAQLDEAVAAARRAFAAWRKEPWQQRAALLLQIGARIEANAEALARLVVLEQGKPLALARGEVSGCVAWIKSTAAMELAPQTLEDSPRREVTLRRQPIGVVGSITPWNWPLMIAVWHFVPALLAGNTVVMKPSPLTPRSTLRLAQMASEILPAGVFNCLGGEGELGAAMSAHSGIDKIIFTGSAPTGRDIMRQAASSLKRLTLELGGNDAAIVLPDAPIAQIARALFNAAFINMGQTCIAIKRLYVHEAQYASLCEALQQIAAAQNIGSGLEEGVTFGPLQNAMQLERVIELVADARAQGGKILCGGERLPGKGYFFPPTLVGGLANGARLVDEEQFGPALPIIAYKDPHEALAWANDNDNGLGGSVWGDDLEQCRELAAALECGTAWINTHGDVLPHCPFGGWKQSGIGVEFGHEGLLECTRAQVIHLRHAKKT